MRKIFGTDNFGYVIGEPPMGCKLCYIGAKIVVFITGKCFDNCYYCPISLEKRGKDIMYVDEEKANRLADIIVEALRISARGAGITGGDPIAAFNRTIRVIEELKSYFGSNFHIHLYTTGRMLTKEWAKELERKGLDELRIHVTDELALKKTVTLARNLDIDVGVEIPAIPGKLEWIKHIITVLDENNVKFINLNELEVSTSNIIELKARGLKPSSRRFMAVEGSHELALSILKWAQENTNNINIHYCPVVYKDKYQLRLRLIRKALALAKHYEIVTDEGTILYAIIKSKDLERIDKEIIAIGESVGIGVKTYVDLAEGLLNKGLIREYNRVEEYPLLQRKILNILTVKGG